MRILAFFRQPPEYVNFCIAEMKSLFAIQGIPPWEIFEHDSPETVNMIKERPHKLTKEIFPYFPMVYMRNHSDEILQKIIDRSLLTKLFIRVLSEGNTVEELIQNVNLDESKDIIESPESLSFIYDVHNRCYQLKEIVAKIDKFGALLFKGPIKLKEPQRTFYVLENWENDNKLNYKMIKSFFGLLINKTPKGSKSINFGYELDKRAYLGPTSTDNNLAFLMANQAMARENSFVFDPFLGTGSLLIAPSVFKSTCFGSEIDPRILHGSSVGRLNHKNKINYDAIKDEKPNIWLNFKQYNLELPEVLRMDSSKQRLKLKGWFDSILCDPPYGWRATVRTQGDSEKKVIKKANKKQQKAEEELNKMEEKGEATVEQLDEASKAVELEAVEENKNEGEPEKESKYYVPTKVGRIKDVIEGLLSLADDLLKVEGRLVFLFPVDRYRFEDRNVHVLTLLPEHPNFELMDYSEQTLTMHKSRVLVTMRKKA